MVNLGPARTARGKKPLKLTNNKCRGTLESEPGRYDKCHSTAGAGARRSDPTRPSRPQPCFFVGTDNIWNIRLITIVTPCNAL